MLKSLGLSSSPKTFTKKLKDKNNSNLYSTSNFNNIHWYDNIYRSLNGYYLKNGESNLCYTTHGQTEIINSEPIEIVRNLFTTPKIDQLFSTEFKNNIKLLLNTNPTITDFPILNDCTQLKLPFKTPKNHQKRVKLYLKLIV